MKINKKDIIIENLKNENTTLKGEITTLKHDIKILDSRNFAYRTRNFQLESFIRNYKNVILVEKGSVDVEDLEKKGFCVIVYTGATPPKFLNLEYRENETRQLEEISKD